MDLKDLLAISGYPGLFRFISQGRNAIIVESLEDKKRMSVYSSSRISTLEETAVFTETEEVPLSEVFRKIYSHCGGNEAPSRKSPDGELKKLFEDVLPEYDRERVYVSDIRKIISWYNLLVKYDLIKPVTGTENNGGQKSDTDGGMGEE
ncbi:MAG: DUF5606 domain-containing protein [Bacteroidales bacterium]